MLTALWFHLFAVILHLGIFKITKMTRLYLVRHGLTFDNAAKILQGQVQGELNPVGIQQAEAVRDKMKNAKIDAFVSSDLHRSMQTCEIIAAPHHKKVETTVLLRERDWGSMTGKFIPDLPKDPKDWPEDVETIPHLKARGYPERVLQETDERNSTHGQRRSKSARFVRLFPVLTVLAMQLEPTS